MASLDYEEHVEVSTKWCKLHKTKSLLQLIHCPLFFLLWPELPVLRPETLREPLEEVFELCELCGKSYKADSFPVDGQVGATNKVENEEFQDGAKIGRSREQTCRSKLRVTFAPDTGVESGVSGNNESSRGEEEETQDRKMIDGKANRIATKLRGTETSAEDEEDEAEIISSSEETYKSRLEVDLTSSTATVEGDMSDESGNSVEKEEEVGERKLVEQKSNEIPTNITSEEDSDDEESIKQKKRCLPFKKKNK